VAQNRSAREGDGTIPLRNQKTAGRMSLRAWVVAVMVAQRLLNLTQSVSALRGRLPFPEHDKSLATDTALGLGVSFCALAKYLHRITSNLSGVSQPRVQH